jgi:hypothetical protein
LTGTRVFVRPNRYEAGRANLVVYNWDKLSTVAVDVNSVLAVGTRYEVRNIEDYFAPPVLSGTFDGQPLSLPMTGLTVASPTAAMLTPPPTGPAFNVFVLLPLGAGTVSNTAPTISSIGNQTMAVNTVIGPIPFTVGDAQTAVNTLILSGSSSNPSLLPNANITFNGSASNRTVTLTPTRNQTGTSTVTLRVSDGQLTNSTSFVLTMAAVVQPTFRIVKGKGNVLVAWPTNSGNFVLQSRVILAATSPWNDVANAPVIIGQEYTVTNDSSGGAQLFRLRSQ